MTSKAKVKKKNITNGNNELITPEVKKLLNEYELNEKEFFIDDKGLPWVTQQLLADLMGTGTSTISDNIQEIWDWKILNKKEHLKELTDLNNLSEIPDKKNKETRGRKKHYYSLDVLTQLGMTLKSRPAREFQKKLRKIVKGLYTGEIKIIDSNYVFTLVSSKPTTDHRYKINQWMEKQGITPELIEKREFTAKLTSQIKELLIELGLFGYFGIIYKDFFEAVFGMKKSILMEKKGLTNPNTIRDHCDNNELLIIEFIEEIFLVKLLQNDNNLVTKRQLLKYAKECAEIGRKMRKTLLKKDEMILYSYNQSALDKYMIK